MDVGEREQEKLIQDQIAKCQARLWGKINSMGDEELLGVWDALGIVIYDPDELWDHELEITMEDWAEAVYSEIEKRKLTR